MFLYVWFYKMYDAEKVSKKVLFRYQYQKPSTVNTVIGKKKKSNGLQSNSEVGAHLSHCLYKITTTVRLTELKWGLPQTPQSLQ